jgi:ADP-ribose pyrophosphatase YjhB (NUDIX family)
MIRIKALAVIVRPADGALLVCEGDDEPGVSYARPVGGSVEFGELAQDAVRREIQEELGCDLASVSLAAVLENRFILNGVAGHEIDFVFRGELADVSLYDRESIAILDVPGLRAVWWSPTTHRSRLVPDGVRELLVYREPWHS